MRRKHYTPRDVGPSTLHKRGTKRQREAEHALDVERRDGGSVLRTRIVHRVPCVWSSDKDGMHNLTMVLDRAGVMRALECECGSEGNTAARLGAESCWRIANELRRKLGRQAKEGGTFREYDEKGDWPEETELLDSTLGNACEAAWDRHHAHVARKPYDGPSFLQVMLAERMEKASTLPIQVVLDDSGRRVVGLTVRGHEVAKYGGGGLWRVKVGDSARESVGHGGCTLCKPRPGSSTEPSGWRHVQGKQHKIAFERAVEAALLALPYCLGGGNEIGEWTPIGAGVGRGRGRKR